MVSAERWREVEELFKAALEREPNGRAAFVEEACGGDEPLRAEVVSLLAHHDAGESFLEAPAVAADFDDVSPEPGASASAASQAAWTAARASSRGSLCGRQIGSYKILNVLAEGGMGVVYLAEQEHPLRSVAVKIIKPGIASAKMLRRFEHESQVLGRLQHPGIAQIFEAGTWEIDTSRDREGAGIAETVPYFAMEFIKGRPLVGYAEANKLAARQRLELMIKICDGVQHAHQKGVIHRDLKPGNILVDESGQPKVLDFGVARAIDSDIQTSSLQTDIGQLIGTIPYMSPEQVAGDPDELDTRSDVYSLGVVLYELLAGRLPYDLAGKVIPEAARVIRDEDPIPLSSVSRVFRGDVETIAAKALEKDKTRRYPSASALAADLDRYLRDEPVVARPPSTLYQLRKFARRNKALVAGVAAAFIALALGTTLATWQAVRASQAEATARRHQTLAEQRLTETKKAREEADQAREESEVVTGFLADMLASVSPEELGRDVLVKDALDEASERVGEKFTDKPVIDARLRTTIGQTYLAVGEYSLAEPHLDRALEIRKHVLGEEHPDTLMSMNNLGALYTSQGRYHDAERVLVKTLEIEIRVLAEEHPSTLASMNNLGAVYQKWGQYDQAEALAVKTLIWQRYLFFVRLPRRRRLRYDASLRS